MFIKKERYEHLLNLEKNYNDEVLKKSAEYSVYNKECELNYETKKAKDEFEWHHGLQNAIDKHRDEYVEKMNALLADQQTFFVKVLEQVASIDRDREPVKVEVIK